MGSDVLGNCRKTLKAGGKTYDYADLGVVDKQYQGKISKLPYSLKILLENLLRRYTGSPAEKSAMEALISWDPKASPSQEIEFMPARVVMQDFTGVPAIVDLAVMRDAMAKLGGDPSKINPLLPVDLVIDHSVQVDAFASGGAFRVNVEKEYERNQERYTFLRWGQASFNNLRVVPPGTGIVHQVNLEYLAPVVFVGKDEDRLLAYPDTVVGTDSHTTMINGLGVLGWGVGGIEAEAAMLGQPISLLIPQVVGFQLDGALQEGVTATDLVLAVTQMLRSKGVVDKFVEFYGPGLANLSLADRATISNMAPEYGATCGLFPIDAETLNYLKLTGRDTAQIALVEAYAKAQGFFGGGNDQTLYSDRLRLDLGTVETSLAGPKRPQDRFNLKASKSEFQKALPQMQAGRPSAKMQPPIPVSFQPTDLEGGGHRTAMSFSLNHGAVVIAAITSCTNTSNPAVMLAAGLVAKKAAERGLKRAPWVKTSLAPGSKVVTDYLREAELMPYLEKLGFDLVGYGCTTCIGNSGPLPQTVVQAVQAGDLVVCAVLSGNRNFEGRINPQVRASYLASPPLVVAYAIAGRMDLDLYHEPLGKDSHRQPVYLKDIWPTQAEIQQLMGQAVKTSMFTKQYAEVFKGDQAWRDLPAPKGKRYAWDPQSTYIKAPPFFDNLKPKPEPLQPLKQMKVLAHLGDSVTTDHISPAGNIAKNSPAGSYLSERGIAASDYNSYGARRGNFEVMVRGTFANIRLRNLLLPNTEGGVTICGDSPTAISIFEASEQYAKSGTPLMLLAGKEYGSGSSRDWAGKGPRLLGVKVVLAESYERIHRSNLIGMGILPLQYESGSTASSLGLTGLETYSLEGLNDDLKPGAKLTLTATDAKGGVKSIPVGVRINTPNELAYFKHGGILHYVLRELAK